MTCAMLSKLSSDTHWRGGFGQVNSRAGALGRAPDYVKAAPTWGAGIGLPAFKCLQAINGVRILVAAGISTTNDLSTNLPPQ